MFRSIIRIAWVACVSALPVSAMAETTFALDTLDVKAQLTGFKSEGAAIPAAAATLAACESCGIDSAVYERALHYYNSCGGYITDSGAKTVASKAYDRVIDVDAFLRAYYKSCNFDSAVEVGMGGKAGTMSSSVYESLLHYYNSCGGYINDYGARQVAQKAAAQTIDVDAFKNSYYRSCTYDSAVEVGTGNKSGTLSAAAYLRALHYYNGCGGYVNDYGARIVGRKAAEKRIDLEAFFRAYYRSCNFDSAIEVSCQR